ncbi:MAG: small subunit ribosomal protein [Actinomycetota bacterium]
MAREQRDRDRKRNPKDTGRRIKKKVCQFCKDGTTWIDYKDVHVLRKFMSDRGKIRTRRVSGNCVQHQRDVAMAIKTSRELALLPYAQRTLSERASGRGGGPGGRGGPRGPRRDDVDDEPTLEDTTGDTDVLDSLLEDAEATGDADETEGDEE